MPTTPGPTATFANLTGNDADAYGRAPTAAMYAQALLDADVNDDLDATAVYATGRPGEAAFIADDGEFEYVVTVKRRSSRG